MFYSRPRIVAFAERAARCRRVANLVAAGYPAFQRRVALAKAWNDFLAQEAAAVRASFAPIAAHAARRGDAEAALRAAARASAAIQIAGMEAADADSRAREEVERAAVKARSAYVAAAFEPFQPYFPIPSSDDTETSDPAVSTSKPILVHEVSLAAAETESVALEWTLATRRQAVMHTLEQRRGSMDHEGFTAAAQHITHRSMSPLALKHHDGAKRGHGHALAGAIRRAATALESSQSRPDLLADHAELSIDRLLATARGHSIDSNDLPRYASHLDLSEGYRAAAGLPTRGGYGSGVVNSLHQVRITPLVTDTVISV
jgi:hypothetical protein